MDVLFYIVLNTKKRYKKIKLKIRSTIERKSINQNVGVFIFVSNLTTPVTFVRYYYKKTRWEYDGFSRNCRIFGWIFRVCNKK